MIDALSRRWLLLAAIGGGVLVPLGWLGARHAQGGRPAGGPPDAAPG